MIQKTMDPEKVIEARKAIALEDAVKNVAKAVEDNAVTPVAVEGVVKSDAVSVATSATRDAVGPNVARLAAARSSPSAVVSSRS